MNRKTYSGYINILLPNQIFVFGSNTEGRHGAGTAKIALKKFGAIYGQAHGLQGKSYGLVTKNLKIFDNQGLKSVTKEQIIDNIKALYCLAGELNHLEFLIAYTASGNNLNGYTDKEMAEMFYLASETIPENIIFEDNFLNLVLDHN